jgi:hypothetical protein
MTDLKLKSDFEKIKQRIANTIADYFEKNFTVDDYCSNVETQIKFSKARVCIEIQIRKYAIINTLDRKKDLCFIGIRDDKSFALRCLKKNEFTKADIFIVFDSKMSDSDMEKLTEDYNYVSRLN